MMKPEYDFSSAEQGKFYQPDTVCEMPIYLDMDIANKLIILAKQENTDLQFLVNRLLRQKISAQS